MIPCVGLKRASWRKRRQTQPHPHSSQQDTGGHSTLPPPRNAALRWSRSSSPQSCPTGDPQTSSSTTELRTAPPHKNLVRLDPPKWICLFFFLLRNSKGKYCTKTWVIAAIYTSIFARIGCVSTTECFLMGDITHTARFHTIDLDVSPEWSLHEKPLNITREQEVKLPALTGEAYLLIGKQGSICHSYHQN